jgi:hypothetical protein
MGAGVDCETIGTGFLGQPVNAVTSLILVAAGIYMLVGARDRWIAAGLAAAGLGSFLFHGPLAPGGVWIHDVTLAWLILVVGLRVRGLTRVGGPVGLAVIGPLFLALPEAADVLTGVLVVIVVLELVAFDHSRATLGPLLLLAGAAAFGRLGATGAPLCDPDSPIQAHAVWHVGAAVAVAWWAAGVHPPASGGGFRGRDPR